MNNLIVLATYWNEIEWIRPSLEQIEKLDPVEVIICDGCFDPRYPAPSTDGTREIIEEFVRKRDNARVISPLRKSLPSSLFTAARGHTRSSITNVLKIARWKCVYATLRSVAYRRNQALTFNHMIRISELWEPGRWLMACDADQFYPDEMIERFAEIVDNDTDLGLLTANEMTFFEDLEHYTDEYEKRNYNNMPHKVYPNTTFIPTRGIIVEEWPIRSLSPKGFISRELYINRFPSENVGTYFHYKIVTRDRFDDGYQVGDRKKPDIPQYRMREFKGHHPSVIRKYFGSSNA